MSISEFYEKINGDYEGMKGRLQSDDLIKRFVLKFVDEKSYSELVEAAANNDVEASIASSHKMKGVVANLSFTALFDLTTAILADLRKEGQDTVNQELMQQITAEYEKTIQLIQEI